MNVLSLVFSILLILSFSFYACLQKQTAVHRLQKTFLSQAKVQRLILADFEKQAYKSIPALQKPKTTPSPLPQKTKKTSPKKPAEIPSVNPECARLNLWPLLKNDKQDLPFLYELFAHLIRLHYKKDLFEFFEKNSSKLEYRFLDAWLESIRKEFEAKPKEPILLEKITFKDPSLQNLYYNMLRGSKDRYPSLLDFVKFQPASKEKNQLCLLHAAPAMLKVFFGQAAQAVYAEMHRETLVVTEDKIKELCQKYHHPPLQKELFELVSLSRFKHRKPQELTLLEEDKETKISIRQKIYTRRS